jgi:hypothetical protein
MQMQSFRVLNVLKGTVIGGVLLWISIFCFLRNPVVFIGSPPTPPVQIEPARLEAHVRFLASLNPNRSYQNLSSLEKAETFIADQFKALGMTVTRQDVPAEGRIYHNVIARYGNPEAQDLIVIGAHYDAAGKDNPGADDNASGVAGLLELARAFQTQKPKLAHAVEFVAYTLEEPPFFATKKMGSAVHAASLAAQHIHVRLMLSLEMIGYFSDEFMSQDFPIPLLYGFFPWTGNFVGLVGNTNDRGLQRQLKAIMSANSSVPVLSVSVPNGMYGVDLSDHRNYWNHQWPAFMITDMAFLRNDQYHKEGDTPDRLNYSKMAEVTRAIYAAVTAPPNESEER